MKVEQSLFEWTPLRDVDITDGGFVKSTVILVSILLFSWSFVAMCLCNETLNTHTELYETQR